MNSLTNPIVRAWKRWFTPRSSDPTVAYRERALRILLPAVLLLRTTALFYAYSRVASTFEPPRYIPFWLAVLALYVPLSLSGYFLKKQRVGLAGACFLLNWYLADMFNLPADGYWYPGYQISLIIEIILGTLLLPTRAIFPFMIFHIVSVGMWGNWLDVNYYDPPLLSTGEPVSDFKRTIYTLAVQESIILFIVRYLRLQMEKSLRLQEAIIAQLKNEMKQRRHLQDEREKHIDELNKKNAELERFAYTVSHDLKSPIVTIKGFVGMLEKDVKEGRPDRVQSDLVRIANATDKMDALLKDLLELSRIGRIINPPEEIDTAQLIRDAIENVDARLRSRNVVVDIAPRLPFLYGDRIRLCEVFGNLMDNAAKYMGEQTSPLIEIGVKEQAGEQVFYVKDNGMGIDPKYHTRIFNLFEKLNPIVEGTGIGLALVKRIIETHSGRVWVESEGLGHGSTFCFTIPDGRKREE